MFPTTRWTLILASQDSGEAEKAALEQLCATYWKPVYFFLRRKGLSPAAAEDAAQGFFLHLLQRDFLPRLDPARGRFRSYLLRSLEHYLVNLHCAGNTRTGCARAAPAGTLGHFRLGGPPPSPAVPSAVRARGALAAARPARLTDAVRARPIAPG
jgi:DNA-directed RNA polymerase specialized sigma24 family protein